MKRSGGFIHPTAIIGDPPEDRTALDEEGFAPEIHSSVIIEAYVSVDAGVKRPTRIGARTYLLKRSHCGHDARIGEDCTLATNCIVGGHSEVGDRVRVGLAAVILPFRKIGDDAVIGAGAVVTRDVPAKQVWAGNPARYMRDR